MMLSTAMKIDTFRMAKAQALVRMAPETMARVKANDLPKPDVIPMARAAGMLAAKRTPQLLPHCHPIPISEVALEFELGGTELTIIAEVSCIAPTGVEMEALTAASVAALTVYDLLKPVDKGLVIDAVKLLEKRGGKSDFEAEIPEGFKVAVITVSDRSFAGKRPDKSGPFLVETLKKWGVREVDVLLLPDEMDAIQAAVRARCDAGYHLVLLTGGTGLSPRDVTIEAVQPLLERELPGVMEAARSFGQRRTPYAMLSRGVAGQRGRTLIITLPGSTGGCRESMAALYPYLFHAHSIIGGGVHKAENGQP